MDGISVIAVHDESGNGRKQAAACGLERFRWPRALTNVYREKGERRHGRYQESKTVVKKSQENGSEITVNRQALDNNETLASVIINKCPGGCVLSLFPTASLSGLVLGLSTK
jgi:hypothetical protein